MSRKLCMKCMNEYDTQNSADAVCPICGTQSGTAAADSSHLAPETILHGRYEVGLAVRTEDCSILYAGRDLQSAAKLLVREFYPGGLCSRNNAEGSQVKISQGAAYKLFHKGMERFCKDGEVMKAAGIPGILRVWDVFRENGTAYFVMEYINIVEGQDRILADLKNNQKFSANEVLSLMMPVLDTLNRMHARKILHLNIRPENIFIRANNNGEVILSDIGRYRIGLVQEEDPYQAMEIRQNGKAGRESDVYSVCAIMYQLLTGETPLKAEERAQQDTMPDLLQQQINLSMNQNNLIMNGLEPYAVKRTKSPAELMNQITSIRPVERIGKSAAAAPEAMPSAASAPAMPDPAPEAASRSTGTHHRRAESGRRARAARAKNNRGKSLALIPVVVVIAAAFLAAFVFVGKWKNRSEKQNVVKDETTETVETNGRASTEADTPVANGSGKQVTKGIGKKVVVTTLTGQSYENAKKWAGNNGLNIAIVDAEPVDKTDATPETIAKQDPEAGEELAAGGIIFVTVYEDEEVSLSSNLGSVKGLSSELTALRYFKPEDSFTKALSNSSFHPNKDTEESNIIPGYVTRVIEGSTGNNEDAEALSLNDKVLKNREVSVVTSAGSENEKEVAAGKAAGISVQDLIGKAVDSGKGSVYQTAEENNFYIGVSADTEYTAKDTAMKSEVAAVKLLDPETGKEADLSSKDKINTWDQVLLVLSSGPERIKITLDGEERYLNEDSLTDYSLSRVKERLKKLEVEVDGVEYAYSSSVAKGNVISTTYDCSYGENEISEDQQGGVHEGDSAVLVVSRGRKPENTTERKKDTGTSGGSGHKNTSGNKQNKSGGGGSSKPNAKGDPDE